MKKQTETIKKFKELILDIYRYAGALDEAITRIETEVDGSEPTNELFFMLAIQARHRQETAIRFGNLEEREKDLWQELI